MSAIGEAVRGHFLDPQPCKEDVGFLDTEPGAVLAPQTEGLAANFESSTSAGTTSMLEAATVNKYSLGKQHKSQENSEISLDRRSSSKVNWVF